MVSGEPRVFVLVVFGLVRLYDQFPDAKAHQARQYLQRFLGISAIILIWSSHLCMGYPRLFIHSVRYAFVIDLYQIHLLCCPAAEEVDVGTFIFHDEKFHIVFLDIGRVCQLDIAYSCWYQRTGEELYILST